jgi:Flp pilus assembly protein TadB
MTFHDFITAGLWVSVATVAVLYAMLQHLLRWHATRRMRMMAQLTKAMDDSLKTMQNGHRKPDATAEEFKKSLRRP